MKTVILYKALIREAEKLPSYNIRMYALRKIKDEFRAKADLKDQKLIDLQLKKAQENLELIRRQVIIGNLYSSEKLVIE